MITTQFKYEIKHLFRNKFKLVALALFLFAAIYGLCNGSSLYRRQTVEIAAIQQKAEQKRSEYIKLYEQRKKSPPGADHIDLTQPFWASWYSNTWKFNTPSPLMVFSTGQAEQAPYYKKYTMYGTAYDQDMSEELANPERLALGTLDFSFVLLFLLPVLLIILLYDIAGTEKDNNFYNLVKVQHSSENTWLLQRLSVYFVIISVTLLILIAGFAFITGALPAHTKQTLLSYLLALAYASAWFIAFGLITRYGKGSTDQALKMVTLWLIICLLLPGTVHQVIAMRYPGNYMTAYLDASRVEKYRIWEEKPEQYLPRVKQLYPAILNTPVAKDTAKNENAIYAAQNIMVNELMKKAAADIEAAQQQKNEAIKTFYPLNPISFFQNTLNNLSGTGYNSSLRFRQAITQSVSNKVEAILLDTWKQEKIGKEKYIQYTKH